MDGAYTESMSQLATQGEGRGCRWGRTPPERLAPSPKETDAVAGCQLPASLA